MSRGRLLAGASASALVVGLLVAGCSEGTVNCQITADSPKVGTVRSEDSVNGVTSRWEVGDVYRSSSGCDSGEEKLPYP